MSDQTEHKSIGSPSDTLQNESIINTTQINLDGVKVSSENFWILSGTEFVRAAISIIAKQASDDHVVPLARIE